MAAPGPHPAVVADLGLARNLVGTGRLARAELEGIVREARASGMPGAIGSALLARGLVTVDQLAEARRAATAAASGRAAAASASGRSPAGSPAGSSTARRPASPGGSAAGSARLAPASASGSRQGPAAGSSGRVSPSDASGQIRPGASGRIRPASESDDDLPPEVAAVIADPSRRIGRYVVTGELGRGGMAIVYRAWDLELRRPVAIKMVADQGGDPTRRERFAREGAAVARLRHPAIVRVFESGIHQDRPYMAMELVEGGSLEEVLQKGSLPPKRIVEIAATIADALAHAHDAGVVHRDVKPENVLIDREGAAHLTDFGLAVDAAEVERLTRTGQLVGTPAYMAPEQIDRRRPIGPGTDVYGLGAMIYRALAGRPPFEGDTALALVAKVLRSEAAPLRRVARRVHPDLETIVHATLEKDPAGRYGGSVRELAADLRRFLGGEPIQARPIGRLERWRRTARRNPLLAVATLGVPVIVLAGGVAAIGAVASRRRAEATSERAVARAETDAVAAERRRAVDEARAAATAAAAAFEEARAASADHGGRAIDAIFARGLDALDATDRLLALAPGEEGRAFEVAMALGEAAVGAEQWSVAERAFERAAELGVDDVRARAALESVDGRRERAQTDRRNAVDEEIVRAKDLVATREGYEEALFSLVGLGGPAAADALSELLGEIDLDLRLAARAALLEAAHPRPEDGPDAEPIEDLARCVDAWLALGPGETAPVEVRGPVERAVLRLERRAGLEVGPSDAVVGSQRILAVIARAQRDAVPQERLALADLASDALGRIGVRRAAVEALGRHLFAQAIEDYAVHAGVALARLGGPRALELVLGSLDRFGVAGVFWVVVTKHMRHIDVDPVLTGETAEAYRIRGQVRSFRGDHAAAASDLDRAVQLGPESAVVWNERGLARLRAKRLDEAVEDFAKAVEVDPKLAVAWNNLGLARLQSGGATVRTLEAFDRALELDPGLVSAWSNRGTTKLQRRQDHAGALTDFDEALRRSPGRADIHGMRSIALAALGRTDHARAAADRALALSSGVTDAWVGLGMAAQVEGDHQGTIAAANRAIELDASITAAWAQRGLAHYNLGRYEEAVADFDRALELEPGLAIVYSNRALCHQARGNLAEGLVDAERACELAPDLAMAWLNRGMLLQASGRLDEAIAIFDRALENDPGIAIGWNNRGICHHALGKLKAARRDFARAVEIDPNLAMSWSNLALARYQLGEHEKAFADARRALKLDPSLAVAHNNAGTAALILGRFKPAREHLEKAVELEPGLAIAWSNLGEIHRQQKRYPDAERCLNRALELMPRMALVWNNRGLVRYEQGKKAEAIADYDRAIELEGDGVPIAWWNRGDAHLSTGKKRKALADFRHFVKIAPKNHNRMKQAKGHIQRLSTELKKTKKKPKRAPTREP